MTQLASQAVNRFGRIDTWVNNASVGVYGTVEQVDAEEIQHVIEVDLLGAMRLIQEIIYDELIRLWPAWERRGA